jgi:hypothetical protein
MGKRGKTHGYGAPGETACRLPTKGRTCYVDIGKVTCSACQYLMIKAAP